MESAGGVSRAYQELNMATEAGLKISLPTTTK
jgi:hypothetical protein